jgi:thiol:disulfide interchange protein DsbC
MNIPKSLSILLVMVAVLTASWVAAATPEESFRASFPDIRVDSIRPAPVEGLYEVVSGSRILYYVPGPEYIVTGEIITQDRRSLTEERSLEIMGRKLREIPLEKALKIGSGPHTVVEITDPDCTYCRKASVFLSARGDLTRYVFFFPLPMHPNAEAKVRYILCAEDKRQAYEEAMSGKLDGMKFPICQDAAVEERLKAHWEIGNQLDVSATPLFLIDGQIVGGADIPLMERILGGKP